MFFVYRFDPAVEDFKIVGAFSQRSEAETYAAANPLKRSGYTDIHANIVEQEFDAMLDHALTVRLGALADILKPILERPRRNILAVENILEAENLIGE